MLSIRLEKPGTRNNDVADDLQGMIGHDNDRRTRTPGKRCNRRDD